MQSWGKTSSGRQRFYCPVCKKSGTRLRPDRPKKIYFTIFVEWLTGTISLTVIARRLRITTRFLRKLFKPFWSYLPQPKIESKNYDILVVDGLVIVNQLLTILIAHNPQTKRPVSWSFCFRENYQSWLLFLTKLRVVNVNPLFVVCDGQKGLNKALLDIWPSIKIQRCLAHIIRGGKSLLTRKPKTEAGQTLLILVKKLSSVRSKKEKHFWIKDFGNWLRQYESFLKEKSFSFLNEKRWWYTHKKLRRARSLLVNSLPHLFTYIDYENVPRTSNHLEGGINAPIKNLLKTHRGLKPRHRQILVAWYLAKRQGQKPTRKFL